MANPSPAQRCLVEELADHTIEEIRDALLLLGRATVVGRWRLDISDQCPHCEPDRLYQTWSKDEGMSYDADMDDDPEVIVLGWTGD